MKWLLVEDEISLATSIRTYLEGEGYLCEWAKDFHEADMKLSVYPYDGALIDITLPGGTGWQLIGMLKKNSPSMCIIVISAKNSIEDKVRGLDLGADDYLTKPFHLAELNSRIKSVWRRRKFEGSLEMQFGEIRILPDEKLVFVHQQAVSLTRKEFDLLLLLVTNKNRVLSKHHIAEHVWGDQAELLDAFDFIYAHIKNIRRKLMEKGSGDYIRTLYGIGYKFDLT